MSNQTRGIFIIRGAAPVLTHYGVPGMHWGRISAGAGSSGGKHAKKMTEAQLNTAKSTTSTGSSIAKEGLNVHKSISNIRKTKHQEDLSKLSDSQLRDRVARMNLEQQYANIASGQVSKGEVYTKNALEITGSVLAIGSSAIGIALAMKQLKGA